MKHKHADVLIAFANGKDIQTRSTDGEDWIDIPCDNSTTVYLSYDWEYRVKPIIKEGWVNICKDDHYDDDRYCGTIHSTKEIAERNGQSLNRVAIACIVWEE